LLHFEPYLKLEFHEALHKEEVMEELEQAKVQAKLQAKAISSAQPENDSPHQKRRVRAQLSV
jgi:hypothetical protein